MYVFKEGGRMKVIDLLNLVYEKKAPKKILFKYCEYEFNSNVNDYRNRDGLELFSYLFTSEEQALYLGVEIIEEDKEIEELKLCSFNKFKTMSPEERYHVTAIEYDKLNEVIRKVNKIEKEGK